MVTILDSRGRPVVSHASEPMAFRELGKTGLKRFGGFVRDEWHGDLYGRKAAKVYREMSDNHPIVGAILLSIELLIRQTSKRVDATGDTPDHLAARELCESALLDVEGGENGICSNALAMLPYGWAWLEKVFKVSRGDSDAPELRSRFDDGRIRWRKLAPRSPESLWEWVFDDAGDVVAMIQRAYPDNSLREIPRSKSAHFRLLDAGKNNPEGRSILRNAYTSYFFQKQIQFSEAVGIERNLAGFPKISVPPDVLGSTDPDSVAAIERFRELGEKTRVDEFACWVVPSDEDREGKTGYKAELIASGGRNVADSDPIVRRYASWVAISMLAKFMLLGVDKHGSFALQESDTDFFGLAVAAVIDTIQEPFTRELFPELCAMNGLPREVAPEWVHGDVDNVDSSKLAGAINTFVGAGVLRPDDGIEDHVREQMNLPPRQTDGDGLLSSAGALARDAVAGA